MKDEQRSFRRRFSFHRIFTLASIPLLACALLGCGSDTWDKRYMDYGESGFSWVEETSDGGFIAVGTASASDGYAYDTWLVKIENDGNIAWDRFFEETGWPESVLEAADGGAHGPLGVPADSRGKGR